MMFSQESNSRNMSSSNNNSMLFSSTACYKRDYAGEADMQMKGKDPMMMPSSDVFEQQQNPSGLTRYRSAPSTFFTSYLDGLNVNNTNSDSSQDGDNEAENMFSAFMGGTNGSSASMGVSNMNEYLKKELTEFDQQQNGLLSVDNCQMGYETSVNETGTGNGGYGGRIDQNQLQTARISCGNSSNNLIRQSSSPAGFFADFDISRDVENFRSIGGSNSTSNGVNKQLNFTTAPSFLPSIAEVKNENIGAGSSKDGQLRNGAYQNGGLYIPNSWNDSSSGSLKRNHVGDMKFSSFDALENEKGNSRNAHGLTHHLSLPKTFSEMATTEKYLEFQQENVVPCKIRAKRGFATHPRSIAERVRRTRISARMKKLQELFPNMDKQTNTADMLDLAVEHIKELQKQVQTLTDVKAKCKCPR